MPVPALGSYYNEFITYNLSTGATQNADSTPTITASRNGADDVSFTFTVTNPDTGRYKVGGTVPATYAIGDRVQISASATISSVLWKSIIDDFVITAPTTSQVVRFGTAQGGSAYSIQLDSGASATFGYYVGAILVITSGTGIGQCRTIASYNGANKQAIVDRAFATSPDNTSVFALLASSSVALNSSLQSSVGISAIPVQSGTAQGGTTSSITLSSGAIATDSIYVGCVISITGGTGIGQSRAVIGYVGSTKVASISPLWTTAPDNTSSYTIVSPAGPAQFGEWGVAQSGSSNTITLDSAALSTNSYYVGSLMIIVGGTGSGQANVISSYNGVSKVATMAANWTTQPDSTSVYSIIPTAASQGGGILYDTWSQAAPASYPPGTAGYYQGTRITGFGT